jgi:hypothetical protein
MNPSNPLQSEEPGIGNDGFYSASAVSPNANHHDKTSSLFTIDRVAKPLPNAAQTLEDPHFEKPERQQPFFDCITQVWHQHIHLYARQLEGYSDEAHYSAVMAAIQYSEKIHEANEFSPDFEGKDDDSFSLHQNPTKTPIISKNILRALPHCPIMHWVSQMCNDPRL